MVKTLQDSLDYSPAELSFGTSGLRGLVSDMTDLECYINARGFMDFLLETDDIKSGSPIALAGDFRQSTPRIMQAVANAITDSSYNVVNLGMIPTPAAAYYGLSKSIPVAMVTGSHIPADRNGIKFYKRKGEVLKEDEAAIKQAVDKVRAKLYGAAYEKSAFDQKGSLKNAITLPSPLPEAAEIFLNRYTSLVTPDTLSGKKIIVYQHSSLAADMLVSLLESLGADVIPVDRSEQFVPIDTENVTPENQAYFKSLALKYSGSFAIVSADGDADRPFLVDEDGNFHRGDVVGAITAVFLKAKSASVPVSASDAVDSFLKSHGVGLSHTKIGSPYVISSMAEAAKKGPVPVVGWEVNGGFLTGSDIKINDGVLSALPTRDAFLPIVCVLVSASSGNIKLSDLFSALPQRFTQAGLLDNFPVDTSRAILDKYSSDTSQIRQGLESVFSQPEGFGKIQSLNFLDGIRMVFDNGDIAHIRPSGNAPQLRIYSTADTQKRADEIVSLALSEPGGLLRRLESLVN